MVSSGEHLEMDALGRELSESASWLWTGTWLLTPKDDVDVE